MSISGNDVKIEVENAVNNGGITDYYATPKQNETLQDLIEHKAMNFSQGNIFKAVYRMNDYSHSAAERDLNKIIWFAERELKRIREGK